MTEAPSPVAERSANGVDERSIANGVALGLPLVTLSVAAVVGVLMGPATAILVVAAGLLLGVIAILWASLRVLSGDAPLSPELEALEMAAQGVDALASRKKMLLRALKDLENEHGIGKLEDEDYAQIAARYRDDLKVVLRRIDATIAPHRPQAEDAVRAHFRKVGLVESAYRGAPPPVEESNDTRKEREPLSDKPSRLVCPACAESNEPDAKFCKGCASKLTAKAARAKKSEVLKEESDDVERRPLDDVSAKSSEEDDSDA